MILLWSGKALYKNENLINEDGHMSDHNHNGGDLSNKNKQKICVCFQTSIEYCVEWSCLTMNHAL